MAAIIPAPIPEQAFVSILQRIATILFEEMQNQAAFAGLDTPKVFLDRTARMDNSEVSPVAFNVTMERGNWDNQDVMVARGNYLYNIDIFAQSATFGQLESGRGDTLAMRTATSVAGAVRYIFSHSKYYTLGYQPGYVHRRAVQSVQFHRPIDGMDANSMSMARIQLEVTAPEQEGVSEGVLISGYETNVKIGITDEGYQFTFL